MAAAAAKAIMAGFQVLSGVQQAEMIRAQSKLTQKIAKLNAKYKDIEAFEAMRDGFTQSARYQALIDQTVGDQQAALASANVDVNFGTAKDLQEETKTTGFLNMLDLQKQARSRAYGLKVDSANIRLNGYFSEFAAEAQAYGALSGGISSALGSSASAYGSYVDAGKPSQSSANVTTSGQTVYQDNTGYGRRY